MLDSFSIVLPLGIICGLIVIALIFYLIRKRAPTELAPTGLPTSQWVNIKDFHVHFVQAGKGPHLFLIHGIGSSVFCWRYIIEELAKNYRVTAIDLPGFGQSSKPSHLAYGLDEQCDRVLQVMKALGIEQCRLLGCSMGGGISLWLARRYPDRFFEVAAISPSIDPSLIPTKLTPFAWTSSLVKFGVNELFIRNIMKRVQVRHDRITPQVVRHYLRPYQNNSEAIKVFIKSTELVRDERFPGELKGTKSKTLILWGEKDQVISVKTIGNFNSIIPSATCLIHPEGGHHLMVDEPEWVVKSLIHFFGSEEI